MIAIHLNIDYVSGFLLLFAVKNGFITSIQYLYSRGYCQGIAMVMKHG